MTGYVNLFGEAVDLTKHQSSKKKSRKEFIPTHSGWMVKGASPDVYAQKVSERNYQIDSARRYNADARKKVKLPIPEKLPPFYEWARKNKNCKAHTKPYSTLDSANQCKKIAEINGWLHVEIIELKKGGVNQIREGVIWR